MKNTNEERSLNLQKASALKRWGECLLIVEGASQDVERKGPKRTFSESKPVSTRHEEKNQAIKEVAKLYQWSKPTLCCLPTGKKIKKIRFKPEVY